MMHDSLRSGGGNRESFREELHARSSDVFVFLENGFTCVRDFFMLWIDDVQITR
jgi:hypothetical protein